MLVAPFWWVWENRSVTKSQSLSPGRIPFPVLQTLAKTLVSFWVSCLGEMHLTIYHIQYVEPLGPDTDHTELSLGFKRDFKKHWSVVLQPEGGVISPPDFMMGQA